MNTNVVALIRHGAYHQRAETPSALQPFPLTDEGRKQANHEAEQFASWVSTSGIDLNTNLYSSTLLRAWETAQIYQAVLEQQTAVECTLTSDFALAERSVGAVANLTLREIEAVLSSDPRYDEPPEHWKSDSHYKLPFDGAESLMDAGRRAANFIELASEQNSITLFFGHGAAFRHAAHHLSVINFCDIKRLSMHYAHPVVFDLSAKPTHPLLYGGWKERVAVEALD